MPWSRYGWLGYQDQDHDRRHMSISVLLVLGLALTSALALTLTEKKHRHWPGSCQRCVGSGASPTVVAQSLLLRRARLLAYLRHAPVPVGPTSASPILLPHRRPGFAPNPAYLYSK